MERFGAILILMDTRLSNRLFAWVIAISYVGQVTAGAVPKTATAPSKWEANAAYVSKWNDVAKKWSKAHGEKHVTSYIKALDAKFNPQFESEDKSYFITSSIQSEDFPEVAKTDKGVVFSLKADPTKKLEISFVEGTQFLINGKEFNYDLKANLKSNMDSMSKLLGMDVAQRTSFLEQLFIPQAHALAGWAWALIAAAVVYIGINLYNNSKRANVGINQHIDGTSNLLKAGLVPNSSHKSSDDDD